MDLDLRDKVCLVTGSTGGIGLATAKLLAEEGARVVVVGRDSERLAQAREAAGAARAIRADLGEPGEPERVVRQTIEELGSVDCLVNNLGLGYQADFLELEDPQWDELWQLNVMSYVRAIRAALAGRSAGSRSPRRSPRSSLSSARTAPPATSPAPRGARTAAPSRSSSESRVDRCARIGARPAQVRHRLARSSAIRSTSREAG